MRFKIGDLVKISEKGGKGNQTLASFRGSRLIVIGRFGLDYQVVDPETGTIIYPNTTELAPFEEEYQTQTELELELLRRRVANLNEFALAVDRIIQKKMLDDGFRLEVLRRRIEQLRSRGYLKDLEE